MAIEFLVQSEMSVHVCRITSSGNKEGQSVCPAGRCLCVCAGSAGGATKRAVLKLLQQEPLKSVTSIIVYCTFQAQADEVAQYLYTQGLSALAYHAGKSFKVSSS